MQRDGHVERLGRRPQWLERIVVDGTATDAIRPDHSRDEVVLLDAARQLTRGEIGVLLRQQRDAHEAIRILGAETCEPVVVDGAHRCRHLGVPVQAEHETEARIEHRGVDALQVERFEPLLRVTPTGAVLTARGRMRL